MAADSYFEDMLNEARSSFIEGNYKVAEPILQQMVLQNTRNPEVFQMLATIAYDKGQFNKAIKTFKRALEIDPTYTDASVGLSIILNDLGRYEEGRQIFDEAKQLLDRRKGEADPSVDEKIATKHEELADLYLQYNRTSEALDQLLKAQKLSSRKAELTLRLAECFIKLGEFDRAMKDLKNLLKDFPHFTAARLKLGLVMYNRGLIAEATEQWENILIRDPENPEALKYLKLAQAAGITSLSL
jgi:tetratricopeptide (TPR) repeat protein